MAPITASGVAQLQAEPLAIAGITPAVWVLVPYEIQGRMLTGATYDTEAAKIELATTFQTLGCPWVWQPVVIAAIDDVVAQVARASRQRPTVAFNLCDGLDWDGCPGLSVAKALERAGVPFTGADPRFYEISTSKLRMKELFREAGVETSAWEVLPRTGSIDGVCDRLGPPLFVKPDMSYASYGITVKSRVMTDAEIARRLDELRHGEMKGLFAEAEIFVERYLAGDEYTILIGGYSDAPDDIWTLCPARRRFADSIPHHERYLSYDRYWGYYHEETPPASGEPFYRYELVEGALGAELIDLATRAYRAVHGHGYARVDVRRDPANGKLSVLEVNANCGLSGDDQTSTGSILALMGSSLPELIGRIVRQTQERSQIRVERV